MNSLAAGGGRGEAEAGRAFAQLALSSRVEGAAERAGDRAAGRAEAAGGRAAVAADEGIPAPALVALAEEVRQGSF